MVKSLPANVGDKRCAFDPRVGKISWRREWQPTSVFLPGETCRQRDLVGYSPWGYKEQYMTEVSLHAHMHGAEHPGQSWDCVDVVGGRVSTQATSSLGVPGSSLHKVITPMAQHVRCP